VLHHHGAGFPETQSFEDDALGLSKDSSASAFAIEECRKGLEGASNIEVLEGVL
jgi:hypothetical protein